MSTQDEHLDDVIASLIDVDDGASSEKEPAQKVISDQPVILTERAARQVMKIKEQESLDLYLRVAVEGGGCSGLSYKLGLDNRTENDELLESHGVEMIVDSKHLMYLDGIEIDYPDGLDARGFTFDNPNATENCGCGTSFAI